MVRKPVLVLVLVLVLVHVLGGCASAPEVDPSAEPALGMLPEDFTLVAIVRVGPTADLEPLAHLRPGRLVVLPDGTLHYGPGAEQGKWIPPPTRTLSRETMMSLYELARRLGFADPDSGELPVNVAFVDPPDDGIVYVIACGANGNRRVFVRPAPAGAELDPDAVTLVRHLAALAWVSDVPDPDAIVLPRRYDLGPDPFERYRQR